MPGLCGNAELLEGCVNDKSANAAIAGSNDGIETSAGAEVKSKVPSPADGADVPQLDVSCAGREVCLDDERSCSILLTDCSLMTLSFILTMRNGIVVSCYGLNMSAEACYSYVIPSRLEWP